MTNFDLMLLFVVVASNAILGILVFWGKRHGYSNRLFGLMILSLIGWMITNYLADNTSDYSLALLWTKLLFIFPSIFAWLLVAFSSFFLNPIKKSFLKRNLFFLIPAIVVCLLSAGSYIVRDIEITESGVNVIFGDLSIIYILYFFGYLFVAFGVFLKRRKKLTGVSRTQINYLIWGLGIFLILASLTNLIIPFVWEIFWPSKYGPYFSFIFIILTSYAIAKHNLLNIKVVVTEFLISLLLVILLIQIFLAEDWVKLIVSLGIFMVTAILGILLIRSILKEVNSREHIEKLNNHLRELLKMKSEFLAIASHQLRTPLTALRGLLSMQSEGVFVKMGPKAEKKYQHDMLISANRLNNIVNDLLDAMELEGGGLQMEWEKTQIEDLIDDSIGMLKPNYEKKGLYLKFKRPDPSLPKIEASPGYLRQIFLNLIDNAEKYTPKGGVTVTAAKTDGKIEIRVKDTGIGVSKKELPKLFEKFSRGRKATKIHTDGSGLGLFIIKRVADEHHGTIDIESPGEGKGTTFVVRLPLKQPAEVKDHGEIKITPHKPKK